MSGKMWENIMWNGLQTTSALMTIKWFVLLVVTWCPMCLQKSGAIARN